MIRVKEEVEKLKNKFEYLNCLETGTIRSFDEKHESTRHISEVIGESGDLKSLDIEPNHIGVSKSICVGLTNIEWIECDSLDYLSKDENKYHFVLLDSVNNPEHIMKEFKLIANRVNVGGSIIIDDAGTDLQGNYEVNVNDPYQAKKGWDVWDWCQDNEVDSMVVVGGHSTQILIPVTENNSKIFEDKLK
jgi:hypothetical protein